MSKKYEMIGQYPIYFNEVYYIAYAGGKRELKKEDQKKYDKILHLPFSLQRKELKKIPMEKNPNVVPIKGIDLLSFVKDREWVPFFDQFFNQSHLIKLTDIIVYESIKQKSYDIALKGQ